MLESNGLKIFKVQKTEYHGGSIRIYCSLNNQSINDYEKFIIEEYNRLFDIHIKIILKLFKKESLKP